MNQIPVHAVVAVDDAIILVCVSILAACGVTYVNQNRDSISAWFQSLGSDLQQCITDIANGLKSGVKNIAEFDASEWLGFKSNVYDFFGNQISIIPISYNVNDSGIYGFTDENQFIFTVPQLSVGNYAIISNDYWAIKYRYSYNAADMGYDYESLGNYSLGGVQIWDGKNRPYFTGIEISFKSNGLTLIVDGYFSDINKSSNYAGNTYISKYSAGSYRFESNEIYSFNSSVIGQKNGETVIIQQSDGKYGLLNINTGYFESLVCGMESKTMFDSKNAMFEWLFESAGIAHTNSTGIIDVPSQTETSFDTTASDVIINRDYFPTDSDLVESESKSIVIPANIADVSTETVLNTDAADVYPNEIPAINAPSNLWTDKFPFCLPWDLYNLVTVFWSDDANPPRWEIPFVIDSAGINETIIIDFGTEPLNQFDLLIDLMKFFIGLSWVFGLILITRKLIGGE